MGIAQQSGHHDAVRDEAVVNPAPAVEPGTHEAGTHLIADFWNVEPIDSVEELERVVRAAVAVARATLLDLRFRQFPGHGGITGYAMLAESHISVHTWPERDYVAIDVFMCGEHRPLDSLEVLRQAFRPGSEEVRSVRRGIGPPPAGTVRPAASGTVNEATLGGTASGIVARAAGAGA